MIYLTLSLLLAGSVGFLWWVISTLPECPDCQRDPDGSCDFCRDSRIW